MPEVLVGIGSNFDPESALRAAVRALEERFGGVECSSVYRSVAVGGEAPDYLNIVAKMTVDPGPDELQAMFKTIEIEMGRTRSDSRVCRLDLDLLAHGARVDAMQRLPRPGIFAQPFVVVPLAEVAPGFVHPLTGERCGAALAAFRSPPRLTNLGPVSSLGA